MLSVWRWAKKHSIFFVKEQFRRMRQILLKKGKVTFPYSTKPLFNTRFFVYGVSFKSFGDGNFFKCTKFLDKTSHSIGWSIEVTLYLTSMFHDEIKSFIPLWPFWFIHMHVFIFLSFHRLFLTYTGNTFSNVNWFYGTFCRFLSLHNEY